MQPEAQALFVSYLQSFDHFILFSGHASPLPFLMPSTPWVHVYLNVLPSVFHLLLTSL